MHLLIKTHTGWTRSIIIKDDTPPTVATIKERIYEIEGIPVVEQRLVSENKDLPDTLILDCKEDNNRFITLLLKLPGGKGGFGSLLRGSASRIGQKRTTNYDACRDLSGRRLRHANNDKKLAEWFAQEDERKLEKVAQAYIRKIANQHIFDENKFTKEHDEINESVALAIENGLEEARKLLTLRKTQSLQKEGHPTKRARLWFDGDFEDPDEEGEGLDSTKKSQEEKVKEKETSEEEKGTCDICKTVLGDTFYKCTMCDDYDLCENCHIEGVKRHDPKHKLVRLSISEAADAILEEEEKEEQEWQDQETKREENKKNKEDLSTTTATTITTTTTPTTSEQTGVELEKYNSAKELEALGANELKTELQKRGLLCGGTVAEKAARLYLLKETPLELLDKKLFSSEKQKEKNQKRKRNKKITI